MSFDQGLQATRVSGCEALAPNDGLPSLWSWRELSKSSRMGSLRQARPRQGPGCGASKMQPWIFAVDRAKSWLFQRLIGGLPLTGRSIATGRLGSRRDRPARPRLALSRERTPSRAGSSLAGQAHEPGLLRADFAVDRSTPDDDPKINRPAGLLGANHRVMAIRGHRIAWPIPLDFPKPFVLLCV